MGGTGWQIVRTSGKILATPLLHVPIQRVSGWTSLVGVKNKYRSGGTFKH